MQQTTLLPDHAENPWLGLFAFVRAVTEESTGKIAVCAQHAQAGRVVVPSQVSVERVSVLGVTKLPTMLFPVTSDVVQLQEFHPVFSAAGAERSAVSQEASQLDFLDFIRDLLVVLGANLQAVHAGISAGSAQSLSRVSSSAVTCVFAVVFTSLSASSWFFQASADAAKSAVYGIALFLPSFFKAFIALPVRSFFAERLLRWQRLLAGVADAFFVAIFPEFLCAHVPILTSGRA